VTATKYLFVTGGVVSSLGKGVAAASLALLLERRGLRVSLQKFDPYLNIDPGTMNPDQHGEVYVLDDGTETDLDLGHYERFGAATLDRRSSTTMGRVYQRLLARERAGDYLGQTIQVVPHVVGEARAQIEAHPAGVDLAVVEIGGTVGDIEGMPVLEAVRQLTAALGADRVAVLHLTHLPYLKPAGELKTKPTQHSVQELRKTGLRPDFLLCRTEWAGLSDGERAKLSLFCDLPADRVFELADQDTVYAVPRALADAGLDAAVANRLGLPVAAGPAALADWDRWLDDHRGRGRRPPARVALVAKYGHADAYKSIIDALTHAGGAAGVRADVTMVDAELLETDPGAAAAVLAGHHGVLVPGGFGARGVAGKVAACRHAREAGLPYFGICLGMQVAVIEAARHLAGLAGADSTEFDPATPYPVVDLMEGQRGVTAKGGTMRLGGYPARPAHGTRLAAAYGRPAGEPVRERHRHRYEVNNAFLPDLARVGLRPAAWHTWHTGLSLVEAVERTDHPWFVGVQYHPEFLSKPTAPHPLFVAFLAACGRHGDAAGAPADAPAGPPATLTSHPQVSLS
jgi:CTP synthase